jgi:hypothetical protein
MLTEVVTTCDLQNLAELQQELSERLTILGVDKHTGRNVQAAAAQAFSAVCLSREETKQFRATLERTRGDLCLRLVFDGELEAAGLSPALYCPPAVRVAFRHGQGYGVWTAFWEE